VTKSGKECHFASIWILYSVFFEVCSHGSSEGISSELYLDFNLSRGEGCFVKEGRIFLKKEEEEEEEEEQQEEEDLLRFSLQLLLILNYCCIVCIVVAGRRMRSKELT